MTENRTPNLTSCFFRAVLFFSCRNFLLRSLYHDLQDLSSDGVQSGTHAREESDFELETLPTPSTQPDAGTLHGKKASLHSTLARSLFSASFSESCTMFLMLMLQGMGMLRPRARLLNWKLSLFLLLAIILLFIPLSLSLVLTIGTGTHPFDISHVCLNFNIDQSRKRSIMIRVALSLVPVILYLLLLSWIPLPDALASSDMTTTALSRLIVLGTIILGLLSGFGAVSNAWAFFPLFSRNRTVTTEGDLSTAEQSLSRIRRDLQERKAALQLHEASKDPEAQSTWSRVVSNFRNDGSSDLSQELKGLKAFELQMARNFEALKARREHDKFSGTLKGKIFNWGGQLFAIYCVFRVISSLINILMPAQNQESANNYPDLITHLLAYLLSLTPSIHMSLEDVAVISRQISLVLVGVIILSSMRLVLRGVTRALRITSRNLGASLMLLILAQLMGIYLLSTIVQLRTSFPPPPTRPDLDAAEINLFSTIPEYQLFGSLFDISFLVAAGLSTFGRWAGERVNGLRDGM
ncbi:hypothetical protein PILCRDRAFT_97557 [Piloderma croceum F 1598]|uniref:Abscisic acid G-protein coupled receptor-like domain-containing protein n=1 Tax=Piloderma croceum (strain F 1598) TaxID=765440 RepID=A0A0C3FBD2_PILCF|nr:hypothetical protein PILCRDRAFT_97557 [Piloderma croceum F 1598]